MEDTGHKVVEQTTSETWAIVCHEFHTGFGPFPSQREALFHARRLTDESDECVFLPIPFVFLGIVLSKSQEDPVEEDPGTKKDDWRERGMYL